MKHLNVVAKLLLSFCIIGAVTACSSDDDDKKTDSIVGQWQFEKYEIQIDPSSSEIENALKDLIDKLTNEDIAKNIATLKDDNTYTIVSANNNQIDKGKYSLSGDLLTLNPGKSGSIKLTIASNSGGKLIFDFDIKQLTSDYPELGTINSLKKANIRITYNSL